MVLATLIGITGCGSLASTLPTGCTKSTTMSVGDTVRTSFGTNSCVEANGTYVDFYNLILSNQTNLVISLSSPGVNTYVQVYDSRRAIIVNSAAEKTPDTTASVRMMLAGDSYQIAVRGTVASAPGAYRLSMTPDTTPVAGCRLIWITPGITTTQHLTNSDCTAGSGGTTHYYHHYEIVMLFSQSITFTEQSSAFTPSMTLFTSLGAATNSTIDTTGSVATIQAFAQSQDAYQLWVGTASALQTGTYTLTVK